MDIVGIKKSDSSPATAQTVAGAASAGPANFFSQFVIRTMKQDLEALAHPNGKVMPTEIVLKPEPSEALSKSTLPTPVTPPPLPQAPISALKTAVQREQIKKERAEQETAKKISRQKKEYREVIVQTYSEAKSLVATGGTQNLEQGIAKIHSLLKNQKASWWLRWKTKRLLSRAQKALVAPPSFSAEKTAKKPAKIILGETTLEPIFVSPSVPKSPPAAKTATPPPGLPVAPPPPPTQLSRPPLTPTSTTAPPTPSQVPEPPKPEKITSVAPPPLPPQPTPPSLITPDLLAPAPGSTPSNQKTIALLAGALLIFAAAVAGFWLWFSSGPSATPSPTAASSPSPSAQITPSPSVSTIPVAPPPSALFSPDKEKIIEKTTLTQQLMQFAQTEEPAGTLIYLLFQDQQNNKFMDMSEVTQALALQFFNLALPSTLPPACLPPQNCPEQSQQLKDEIQPDQFSFFIYSQAPLTAGLSSPFNVSANQGRLGLVVLLKNPSDTNAARLRLALQNLEPSMLTTLSPLLLNQKYQPSGSVFLDNIYQGVAIRYLNLPSSNLAIDWAITEDKLIIATSKESMYALIDRLPAPFAK